MGWTASPACGCSQGHGSVVVISARQGGSMLGGWHSGPPNQKLANCSSVSNWPVFPGLRAFLAGLGRGAGTWWPLTLFWLFVAPLPSSDCPEVVADLSSWVRTGRDGMNPCVLSWLLAGAGVVGGIRNASETTLLGPTGGSWEPKLYHCHM